MALGNAFRQGKIKCLGEVEIVLKRMAAGCSWRMQEIQDFEEMTERTNKKPFLFLRDSLVAIGVIRMEYIIEISHCVG